jgi:GNAT superfamily N-acetyltransferase
MELDDLFVDPNWMRQGAGRALVLDLVAAARNHGARRVEVTANEHALAFYKIGFVSGNDVWTRFGPAPRMLGRYFNTIMVEEIAVAVGMAAIFLWLGSRVFVQENA